MLRGLSTGIGDFRHILAYGSLHAAAPEQTDDHAQDDADNDSGNGGCRFGYGREGKVRYKEKQAKDESEDDGQQDDQYRIGTCTPCLQKDRTTVTIRSVLAELTGFD